MALTPKQKAILKIIKAGNMDGSYVDMDQLLERVPYQTTKQSMQFSIRSLIRRGMIEKAEDLKDRAGRKRVQFHITEKGWNSIPLPKA